MFIERVNRNSGRLNGSEFPNLSNVYADTAPDAFDIDWNNFSQSYAKEFHLLHALMFFLFFIVSPVVYFYFQYTLSEKMASIFLSDNADVTKSVAFTLFKVVLSTIYQVLCGIAIDTYYTKKPYKTFSERVDSKFYFFNFYCLMNNLVADFYGTMSAGIKNMDKQDNSKILEQYSSYIFMTAVKVGISLVISPYTVKLTDHVWKWANMIKYKIRKMEWPTNYNRVISDIPVEHNFDFMATFIVQTIFTIGFFQPFMIPTLSGFFVLTLVLFYFVEKKSLSSWQSHRKGLNINRVKLMYTTSLLGFLFI